MTATNQNDDSKKNDDTANSLLKFLDILGQTVGAMQSVTSHNDALVKKLEADNLSREAQTFAHHADYIEFTLEKVRRPYLEEIRNRTLFSLKIESEIERRELLGGFERGIELDALTVAALRKRSGELVARAKELLAEALEIERKEEEEKKRAKELVVEAMERKRKEEEQRRAIERRSICVMSEARRAPMWRRLRHEMDAPIISSWIDELFSTGRDWKRHQVEDLMKAKVLVVYAKDGDGPMNEAIGDIYTAIAHGTQVYVLAEESFMMELRAMFGYTGMITRFDDVESAMKRAIRICKE